MLVVLLCCFQFAQLSSVADGRPGLQIESKNLGAGTAGSDAHPILVELFTSEGCSSCPPADAFLRKMDDSKLASGGQLIVLSEHVDYWDHDGWKDPNSSAALTERQTEYARELKLDTPYTPQFIVDGTSELLPQDPKQVDMAVKEALTAPKLPVHIGEVSFDGENPTTLRTRIEAVAESKQAKADVFVAVALDRVESQVLKGENSGRHLTHVAVVQQLTKIGKLQKGKSFDETVELKLKPGTDPKNVRVVAFVQAPGPGRLLGVALRKPSIWTQRAYRPWLRSLLY